MRNADSTTEDIRQDLREAGEAVSDCIEQLDQKIEENRARLDAQQLLINRLLADEEA